MKKCKSEEKVSIRTGMAYGSGNFAANLLVTTAGSFLSYFYTEIVGIKIGIVGIILLGCRLLDGISDLCMGAVIDKTRSKYGKARPWILWLSIPFAAVSLALWWNPQFSMAGKIAYAVFTYFFSIVIVYTAIAVPYNTLCSLITTDSAGRTTLSAWRTALGFTGVMFVNLVTLSIVDYFGGGSRGWRLLGGIYGVAGCLMYFFTFFNCKEIDVIKQEKNHCDNSKQKKSVNTITSIKYLMKNKYWLMMIVIILVTFTISGLAGANVYYAKYIFHDSELVGTWSVLGTVPMLIGVIFMPALVKRYGKRNVMMAGEFIQLVGIILIGLFWDNWSLFMIGLVLKGVGQAPIMVVSFAMLSDTIDFGEWKFGARSDGMAYSAEGFGEKVGGAIGSLIVTGMMSIGGYIGKQTIQAPGVYTALRAAVIYVPAITTVITIIILCFYDLDKIHLQILKELSYK